MTRSELLVVPTDARAQREAIDGGYLFEGMRRGAGDGGGDLQCWVRLDTDPPGPSTRTFPDPPAGGLTDGVVVLRPQELADAEVLWETSNEQDSVRWAIRPAGSLRELMARIQQTEAAWLTGHGAHWSVCDATTGAVVGDVAVQVMDALTGRANLGYATHPDSRRRGYAVRAARLCAAWAAALPSISRVEAGANVANTASLIVLDRAGFVREGVLLGLLPSLDGGRQDVVQYSWPSD